MSIHGRLNGIWIELNVSCNFSQCHTYVYGKSKVNAMGIVLNKWVIVKCKVTLSQALIMLSFSDCHNLNIK